MSWMSRHTGRAIGEVEHIRQSIADILSTPRGSRAMRRDYGSYIFELIDQPSTEAGRLLLMAVGVDAVVRQEPRPALVSVDASLLPDGRPVFEFNAYLGESDTLHSLTGIEVRR